MTEVREVGNFENPAGSWLLQDTILDLRKSIAFFLAEENRARFAEWDIEEFAAAIDLMSLLGERSEFGPGIVATTVQRWRELYFPLYDQRYPNLTNSRDPLRDNISKVFDRLEALAALHPPHRWGSKEQS
jgi:hypothetical protein